MNETLRLGDVCSKIGSGATPRGGRDTYSQNGPYALIRSQNIYNDHFSHDGLAFISEQQAAQLQNVEVREGDVLLNITGDSVARVCQVDRNILPARVNQHVAILRPDPAKLDAKFLRYFLVSPEMQSYMLTMASAGATRNALTKTIIENFQIPAKSVDEQNTIASMLGALDEKIDLNRRMNETLEHLARALFRDWFVDFGPTKAKMEGREAYLEADLWALFPERLDDEGKPEGWEKVSVGDDFRLTMGQSPPGETYNEVGEGLPFFQGRTDFGFRYPTNRKYCTAPIRIAEAGDTLVSVRAPVGDINLSWQKCCIGRGVAALRHLTGGRSYTYYAAWTLQPALQQFEHTGTVFGAINKKQFEALEVTRPSSNLIDAFEKLAGFLDDQIQANVNEALILAQTRDLLLPKLMSGELRVRDAEALLSGAL